MTPEPKGPTPEETPAEPASTRWSEDQEGEAGELMPPYIPGQQDAVAERDRDEPDALPELETTTAGGEAAPEPEPAPEATGAPPAPAPPEVEAEQEPELEPEPLSSEDVPAGLPDTTEPEPPDEAGRAFPFDMPWGETAEPASPEPLLEGAETPGTLDEPTSHSDWEAAAPADADTGDMPFGAFDVEAEPPVPPPSEPLSPGGLPGALPGEAGEWESPDEGGYGEAQAAGPGAEAAGPAGELAARLDALAARIRSEGRAAVEQDLASGDRFTAVLAGVLAGYLAARDD